MWYTRHFCANEGFTFFPCHSITYNLIKNMSTPGCTAVMIVLWWRKMKKSRISKLIKVKMYHYFHIFDVTCLQKKSYQTKMVWLSHHLLCSLFISQFIFVQAVTSDIHKYVYKGPKANMCCIYIRYAKYNNAKRLSWLLLPKI